LAFSLFHDSPPHFRIIWDECDAVRNVLDEVLYHASVLLTNASASVHSRGVLGELHWLASLNEVELGVLFGVILNGGFHRSSYLLI